MGIALLPVKLPKRQYIVTCKNCGNLFASDIEITNKGTGLDKLTKKSKETCPACRQTLTLAKGVVYG